MKRSSIGMESSSAFGGSNTKALILLVSFSPGPMGPRSSNSKTELRSVLLTRHLPEIYVAVDIEADGPLPGLYSMLSLGMAAVGFPELRFYTEMRPISDQFQPEAVAVSG